VKPAQEKAVRIGGDRRSGADRRSVKDREIDLVIRGVPAPLARHMVRSKPAGPYG